MNYLFVFLIVVCCLIVANFTYSLFRKIVNQEQLDTQDIDGESGYSKNFYKEIKVEHTYRDYCKNMQFEYRETEDLDREFK